MTTYPVETTVVSPEDLSHLPACGCDEESYCIEHAPIGDAPIPTSLTTHQLVSGESPVVGLRVFTNDWVWGTITRVAYDVVCGTYCGAWHDVTLDDGRRKSYNCDRLTTRKPR